MIDDASARPRPCAIPSRVIAPRVQRWLKTSRQVRILHLFDDVCNLVNESGEVVSLVVARVGPGPFSVVVDAESAPWAGMDVATSVGVQADAISIGPLRIQVDCATLWHPSPNWTRLRKISASDWPTPRPLSEPIATYLAQLLTGLTHQDQESAFAAARSLAGLGVGLTPTGDDVLMGVLYGLWVWQPQPTLLDLVVDAAQHRTTTLSAAFLRAARDGEATAAWHHLANGRADAVAEIHAIGHSSGAEAWAAFVATCAAFERRPRNVG